MSHVSYVNESCLVCEWVMSHMWMSHVSYVNESCLVCEWVRFRVTQLIHVCDMTYSHVYRDVFACIWGTWQEAYKSNWLVKNLCFLSLIWMSHGPCHLHVTWLIRMYKRDMARGLQIQFAREWVMFHVTYMNASQVMSLTWMSHDTLMKKAYLHHERFARETWLIYVCVVWLILHDTFMYVWHDSFRCVTWLVYTCDIEMCNTSMSHTTLCHRYKWVMSHMTHSDV